MSELTQCNYCSLRHIKAEAKREKKTVTLLPGRPLEAKYRPHGMRGIDVYIHPRKVNIRALRPDQREKYWASWFWELSDHCVC
jgi:hypothetical protein